MVTSTNVPVYTLSKFGKPVILIGAYRYNRHSRCKGPRAQWLCCKWSAGCRASVTTIDNCLSSSPGQSSVDPLFNTVVTEPVFTTSRYGKPVIMMGNFRYNRYSHTWKDSRAVWRCVKWASAACRASIITVEGVILMMKNGHNHK
ncbi:unnamed protein product, partial [Iphiclides podalirius]